MKDDSVRVRLTTAEKELFKVKAYNAGMTVSDYIKYCCLINPPVIKTKNKKHKT